MGLTKHVMGEKLALAAHATPFFVKETILDQLLNNKYFPGIGVKNLKIKNTESRRWLFCLFVAGFRKESLYTASIQ